jgi:hypothetical protein
MFTNEKHANSISLDEGDRMQYKIRRSAENTWDPTLAEHRQLCAAYLSVV